MGPFGKEFAAVTKPPQFLRGRLGFPEPTHEDNPPQGHFWHISVTTGLGYTGSSLATASNFLGRMSAQDQKSQIDFHMLSG